MRQWYGMTSLEWPGNAREKMVPGKAVSHCAGGTLELHPGSTRLCVSEGQALSVATHEEGVVSERPRQRAKRNRPLWQDAAVQKDRHRRTTAVAGSSENHFRRRVPASPSVQLHTRERH